MRPGMSSLAGHVGSGLRHDLRRIPRTAGRAPGAFERLDVGGEDGPDRADLGAVQALAGQETAHIGFGRPELGGGLGNRK